MTQPAIPDRPAPRLPARPEVRGTADKPLMTGPNGLALLAVERAGGEIREETRFPDAPLFFSAVVLWRAGRLLLVHELQRDCWELPSGGIEPGETPREAAARELFEEACQVVDPDELRFVGFVRTVLPRHGRAYGAVYAAELDETAEVQPFAPTGEIGSIHWWDPAGPPPPGGRLQTVDSYIVELMR